MTKISLLIGLFVLLVAGFLVLPDVVDAYKGDPSVKGPNYSEERHEAMTKAFQNRDYQAWKALMNGRGGRVSQVINEQNFSRFAEAHQLAAEGKFEEARQIRAELGLGQGGGKGRGTECGMTVR